MSTDSPMQSPTQISTLPLDDIQGIVLRNRPAPYVGAYFLLRVDDSQAGRRLLGRLADVVDSATSWWSPARPALLNVALTYQGLTALGVPQTSLDSFPPEFQQGMAARRRSATRRRAHPHGGSSRSAPVRCTWYWRSSPTRRMNWQSSSSGRARPARSCPASRSSKGSGYRAAARGGSRPNYVLLLRRPRRQQCGAAG
jgi:hypothetical protein